MATALRRSKSSGTRATAGKGGTPRTAGNGSRKASSRAKGPSVSLRACSGARVEYRIYPSIGIARIGDSDQAFFIGPESPGSLLKCRSEYNDAPALHPCQYLASSNGMRG